MTKERFTLEETDWSYRIRDNGAIMKIPKIVDLLNEQHETITDLEEKEIELGRNYLIKLEFEQKVKDTLQAFILGIEDEKGIDKDNEQFQKSMDCALKYLKRLSEELGIDFE